MIRQIKRQGFLATRPYWDKFNRMGSAEEELISTSIFVPVTMPTNIRSGNRIVFCCHCAREPRLLQERSSTPKGAVTWTITLQMFAPRHLDYCASRPGWEVACLIESLQLYLLALRRARLCTLYRYYTFMSPVPSRVPGTSTSYHRSGFSVCILQYNVLVVLVLGMNTPSSAQCNIQQYNIQVLVQGRR